MLLQNIKYIQQIYRHFIKVIDYASFIDVEKAEQTLYINCLRAGRIVFDTNANKGEQVLLKLASPFI